MSLNISPTTKKRKKYYNTYNNHQIDNIPNTATFASKMHSLLQIYFNNIITNPGSYNKNFTSIIVSTKEMHSHLFTTNIANYMHVTSDYITNDIPVLRLFYILTLINKTYKDK